MRNHYMPLRQFFEKIKQLPPEEPFTLNLSDDSNAKHKRITRIDTKKPAAIRVSAPWNQ